MLLAAFSSIRPAPTAIALLKASVRQSPAIPCTFTANSTRRFTTNIHSLKQFTSSSPLPHKFNPSSVVQSVSRSSAFAISSNTFLGAGAATTCLFGPLIWGRAFNSHRAVAHCAPATPGIRTGDPFYPEREPLINSKELTFGAAMGLCSGYLFKKLGKMMMLVVGLGFVWLQLLSNAGYITVNWNRVERRFKQQFDLDQDGAVTLSDAKHGFRWIIELLTRNFQFKSTFAGGFFVGFKYG